MPNPSTRELFEIFFPDPMPPGQLAIDTTTLKSGTRRSHWFHQVPQADRLCRSFRSTRRVRVGAGLQSREKALAVAHERRPRAHAGNIRGCDASVTALTTLWVVIPFGAAPLPPGLQAALGLVDAVDRRPAIVISACSGWSAGPRTAEGGVAYAFWRLSRPWLFAPDDDSERAAARAMLARLQGAVARRAAELGWRLGAGGAGGLAAAFPLPGFPVGARAGGPRAVLEAFPLLPGDGLCRRRDFESLPEPPAAGLDPWHDILHPAGAGQRRLHAFPPIAAGCSWIGACRAERARLSPRQLEQAVRLLARCQAPGADNRRLVHLVCGGHPGSDPLDADRLLARALRDPGEAITCDEIGKQPGVIERHCSKCPHFGRIQSPVELAVVKSAAVAGEAPVATATEERPDAPAAHPASAPAPAPRKRIVVTGRRHQVNDQALAALAAGAELFERRGTLVELARHGGAPPAVCPVRQSRLEELLSRHCRSVHLGGDGEAREAAPPRWTIRGLLAQPRWPELPQLEAGGPHRAAPTGAAPAGDLVEALEPVLDTLGGAATPRRIPRALAADPGRFPALARAFERLAPGLAPGDPGAAAALGYRLRALKDRSLGGRVLVESGRTANTVVWAVERPGPATPECPSSPFTRPKEESHVMKRTARLDPYGPSAAALDHLERIERHRDAFRDVAESQHQSAVRSRLERHFDFMEEIVCEEAFDPAVLVEAWQEVEQLESLYWQESEDEAPKPEEFDPRPEAANDTTPTPKAA